MNGSFEFQADGAIIAIAILGHKIVSPDQEEALYSLQCIERVLKNNRGGGKYDRMVVPRLKEAVDQLVRKCGPKVHNRVGKFRFLNQIVKLITPKYLGAQTSPEVYDSLKEHKLVSIDPVIPEDDIMTVQIAPPKLAVFEDEEKSRLLKELLNSRNPNDLQAANRLIQTLVKAEDQKLEGLHKRTHELQRARQLCKQFEEAFIEKTVENLGITAHAHTDLKMKTLTEELMSIRPHLFRFASDATENDEEALAEILVVNDQDHLRSGCPHEVD
ncbi:hypothetical protein KIN20_006630 [Parelaphostrongylus tenuis]|uniref:Uncharacterized protein n=1 Tax=Parelaphostrongylus tenuis TaxID=148309 RepID=A0AAD5MKE3_PARTN|nr:hypothetical protein KIN20_006630 [Parelaphostrongylus tenuis]